MTQQRKRALITGITGQDGSYLSELLLEKGYEVHGIIRRTSTFNTDRIDHLYMDPHSEAARLFLHYGDLTDGVTLRRILEEVKPAEIYNLGAQSHVRVSFDSPEYTVDTVAMGTLRLLEAIRDYQQRTGIQVRFYQAGSSEMFGKVLEVPQKETTPFYPRSPYSCAKVYAHWQTVNYRESYDLFACNGILFNHECVIDNTPVFIRQDGLIDLVSIAEIVPHDQNPGHKTRYTTDINEGNGLEVWDAQGWVQVTCMTATWNGATAQPNKTVHRIAAEGAVYHATSDHVVFVEQGELTLEKPAGEVKVGDSLALIDLPRSPEQIDLTETEAWLLGVLVAAAEIDQQSQVTVTISDETLIPRLGASWRKVCGGTCDRLGESRHQLSGNSTYSGYLRSELYSKSQDKRIPKRILNAGDRERLAFLDGFKSVSPLSGDSFTVQTPSSLLAAGLYWMSITTLQQPAWIGTESQGDGLQYQIHINATRPQDPTPAQVVTAEPINYQGWLFDLATTSGTFHAGVGQGWIHNSPRRGETFVTRKITRAVARIVAGKQKKLFLGNLDSKRDWGYAKDYVRAMWLMLQQDEPDDYVIATNETHTIRKFLDLAFNFVNLNWEDYVEFDPRYLRPAEVDLLIGDPSKAKEKLGWEPSITFEQLVALMVDSDLKAIGVESPTGQSIIDRAFIRQDGHTVD